MKKFFTIIVLIGCVQGISAAKKSKVVRQIKAWTLSEMTAMPDTVVPDTLYLNYPQSNPIDRYSIANAYNGSTLSPLQAKIYFDRQHKTDFLFADAYNPYIITPLDVRYYNTRTPYSNITYRTGGSTYRKEDNVSFMFTGNANKRTNYGITLDYMAPVGEYPNQAAKRFNGSLFASYNGRRYYAHGALMLNTLNNHENGGIADAEQLNDEIKARDVVTKLSNALSGYRYIAGYYNHGYSLGIERETLVPGTDSVAKHFVPVTTFAHTLKIDQACHRYIERQADTLFYANTYLNHSATNDTANVLNISNTLAVTFEEEFNKWLGFGLTAYLNNETQRFVLATGDSAWTHEWRSNTRVGGVLSRNRGRHIRYNFGGDLCLVGYKMGEFKVDGKLTGIFRLGRDTASVQADAYVRNEEPNYFLQHYTSNHFVWNNDFEKTYRTYVGGQLYYPNKYIQTRLKVGFENVSHYIYFDANGMPTQHNGNVQVLAADLQLNFRLKHFALENNAVYQQSSSSIMPLPTLSLYHNLYYYACLFKVLNMQLGVDARYHTAYYAPLYMPATGQFCLQSDTKVGNYPICSAYINCKLKTVRFYAQLSHFNYWFTNYKYYSMPGYPLNQAQFKLGVSWNFFD